MASLASSEKTLAGALWPAQGTGARLLRGLILVIAGTAILTISAKIKVPFYPVPITMQTFVVLVMAMAFGWRLGAATVALYLAQGAMGLPVFTGTPEQGIGFAYMMGPTGGYLAGMLLASFIVGGLAEQGWDRSFIGTLGAMLLGTAAIFLLGLTWLSTLVGVEKAIAFGLTPFLLSESLKIALAVAVMPLAWKLMRRR